MYKILGTNSDETIGEGGHIPYPLKTTTSRYFMRKIKINLK